MRWVAGVLLGVAMFGSVGFAAMPTYSMAAQQAMTASGGVTLTQGKFRHKRCFKRCMKKSGGNQFGCTMRCRNK